MVENQRTKTVILPKKLDIVKLYKYIIETRNMCIESLDKKGFDMQKRKLLGECLLMHIQIFNCRRAGETERIKKDTYEKCEKLDPNSDSHKNFKRKTVFDEIL